MEYHQPVLKKEVIEYLKVKPGDWVVDGTVGDGGHVESFLKIIGHKGMVIAIDQDKEALVRAKERLFKHKNIEFVHNNFRNLNSILHGLGIRQVDKMLLDLGYSSFQIDSDERGFSFDGNVELDMRMNKENKKKASDILMSYSESELARIFKDYGEEKMAIPIARKIGYFRKQRIKCTGNCLSELIKEVYQRKYRKKSFRNPASKVFQALRIEVNKELENLSEALPQCIDYLRVGGRLAVISFHSLEDRIVKRFFKNEARDCICPTEAPICNCGHKKRIQIITKRPVTASSEEVKENFRSRSAKLRIIKKISTESTLLKSVK